MNKKMYWDKMIVEKLQDEAIMMQREMLFPSSPLFSILEDFERLH